MQVSSIRDKKVAKGVDTLAQRTTYPTCGLHMIFIRPRSNQGPSSGPARAIARGTKKKLPRTNKHLKSLGHTARVSGIDSGSTVTLSGILRELVTSAGLRWEDDWISHLRGSFHIYLDSPAPSPHLETKDQQAILRQLIISPGGVLHSGLKTRGQRVKDGLYI